MTAPVKLGEVGVFPHPGVTPVELWDVLIDGATLFERRDEPTFYASLARAALALRGGEAMRASHDPLGALGWDSVALVGGAVDERRARDAFDAARIPLDVVSDDPFFASSHGREALAEQHEWYADAVVVDIGQTAVKACGPGGRSRRSRTTKALDRAALTSAEVDAARAAFVEDVASALSVACQGERPSFLLLGVPCEVGMREGRITLGASTYPIDGEAVPLVRAVLERAGHPAISSAVVNDAVLAGWALGVRSPTRAGARLVLTLGLGVGAALVDRAPADS